MPITNNKQRRRGVRASREKLTRALAGAGLRTQVALAERIADLEDLDSIPRDAVSRAFRELPVELVTLERIARALEVDAHTLYLTSADVDDEPVPGKSERSTMVMAIVLLSGFAAFWLHSQWQERQAVSTASTAQPVLDLGGARLIVQPFDGDAGVSGALREELSQYFTVATATASGVTTDLAANEVAEKLRGDAVIEGNVVTVGRLSAVRVFLFAGGQRHQVWGESLPTGELHAQLDNVAQRAALAVRYASGLPVPDDARVHFPIAPVQDDYLEGELHLDRPSSELNVRRAESRFEAALRQDANYARAHAGLCQALLEEHWMANEERALQDAARACGQALLLDADDPIVAAAHAHFLRRTGRNDEALDLYASITEAAPYDSSALYGYANSLLAQWRESGNEQYLADAKDRAARAAAVDPYVWKPLFALATMHWFSGDVAAAIEASEAARQRDENEFVLANLGSFYICDGAFDDALEAYTAAQRLAPDSYVGDEFLGMANYFLGNFEDSARLRQRAIEKIGTGDPEIHEMWGNLGDAERMAGNVDAAISAYTLAAEIAERDHLRGTQPVADQAARAWYYTALASLDDTAVPPEVTLSIDADLGRLADEQSEASAHRRMAQTFMLREQFSEARAALDRATTVCRGYRRMPDFLGLAP